MESMTTAEYKKMMNTSSYQKKEMNRIRGSINKANGETFESLINAACTTYELQEKAFIEKTPEPMKVLKRIPNQPGKFIACFSKKAQPDYKGVLKGGKAINFDAKHTDKDRILQSCISSEQEKCLDKNMEMGASCSVVVSFGFNRFFRIPWGVWKNMKQIYGRKYIKPEDVEQYEVPLKNGCVMFLN